mgnify:CR=1 FL=1
MYELIQAWGNSYYIQSLAKIGLVRLNDKDVCLIDSGNDKDAGRKVRKLLDEKGWNLKTIYNTHSNSDHIGGNKYLQGQTGCEIFAPGIECDFTNHTILEPAFIYGGFAPKDLRHKFILAQPSKAQPLTEDSLPDGWQLMELKGHFFDMVGFRTQDDVVYLADCLSSRETIDKYRIGFIYDVGAYIETLERVKKLEARLFIPSHAEPAEDIAPLAQYNIEKVKETAEKIAELCCSPINFEKILQRLFDEYGLEMNFEQHALAGSTVKSYLAWLRDTDVLDVEFADNMLLWKRK